MLLDYLSHTKTNNYFYERRKRQARYWMYESINEQLKQNFYQNSEIKASVASLEAQVLKEEKSSFIAARELLDAYFKNFKK